MSQTLHRDIYSLRAPGFPIDQVQRPDPDPLAAVRYSCVYWVEHLREWVGKNTLVNSNHFDTSNAIDRFLRQHYLHWLEALSLIGSISEGVHSVVHLKGILEGKAYALQLLNLVRDARRFLLYYRWAIENNPLQVYISALIFSPVHSSIRELFQSEEPDWITSKPAMESNWSSCLQTLEDHSGWVGSVVFSHDGTHLASASGDQTIKIWDASSGKCLQTLNIGRSLSNILFDTTGSFLHTEIGTFNLDVPSASLPVQSTADYRRPRRHGYGLNSNNMWIMRGYENLLWLPSEYRSSASAISASTVAIGCPSGRVLIFKFLDS